MSAALEGLRLLPSTNDGGGVGNSLAWDMPADTTHLDRFLAGLVSGAADELAAENLTELDRFLAKMVSDAADELAAYSPTPVYHVNPAIHGPVDADLLRLIVGHLESLPPLAGPVYIRRGSVTPAVDYSGERQFSRARRTGVIGGSTP